MIPFETIVYVKSSQDRKEIHEWARSNQYHSFSYCDERFPKHKIRLYTCNECGMIQQGKKVSKCCESCDDYWYNCIQCYEGWFTEDDVLKEVFAKNAIVVSKSDIKTKLGIPKYDYNILNL